ncbi:hypothetical protein DM558_07660 [Entomomonas moraniae]|uniref:Phage holin family protein n=1 Tax=Entomomonas moraniae TaxID=2213226 RepID=A0A3Q9JNB0_9GAMM|nr:putative holin [Entomomonas moraniae]AZS50662.1 hypothetical protein DM558_07660 [Entomomonas moraniae]
MPIQTTSTWTLGIYGFSFIGLLSGVHPAAIWGALIGSIIYLVAAPQHRPFKKFVCFFTAWVVGYYVALELVKQGFSKTEGAIACLASAISLPIIFAIIDVISNGKLFGLISEVIKKRYGGGNDDN